VFRREKQYLDLVNIHEEIIRVKMNSSSDVLDLTSLGCESEELFFYIPVALRREILEVPLSRIQLIWLAEPNQISS
jgi:hypothetical protein